VGVIPLDAEHPKHADGLRAVQAVVHVDLTTEGLRPDPLDRHLLEEGDHTVWSAHLVALGHAAASDGFDDLVLPEESLRRLRRRVGFAGR
jgi:hypothetical protein